MELTGQGISKGLGRLDCTEGTTLFALQSEQKLSRYPAARKKSIVSRRYGANRGAMLMSAALHCQAADSSGFYDAER